jgi:hypothetical protein
MQKLFINRIRAILIPGLSIISTTFIFVALTFLFKENMHDRTNQTFTAVDWRAQNAMLNAEVKKNRAELIALQEALKETEEKIGIQNINASDSPPTETLRQITALRIDVIGLKTGLADLRSNLNNLNVALTNSPDKALAMPLLRKDLDDMKANTQHDLDSLRTEMTRAYDLNKWIIGFLLAAVLGTVLNNVLQSRSSNRPQAPRFE